MIVCDNVVKIYKAHELEVFALQGLDLTIEKGELMAIIGSSGSGKSTLLNLLGGLERPSAGSLLVDGKNLLRMTEKELKLYKRLTVGFVWQNQGRNLIPYLTAQQNVELPMLIKGRAQSQKAKDLLKMVGLGHRLHNRLDQLSGGEQQRVAIAIALANDPPLLLADEPTGSVDSKTGDQLLNVFREINETLNTTIVIVTHDTQLMKKVDRVVSIRDGKTSSEMFRMQPHELEEQMREGMFTEETHMEYTVVDRAGRLQIPEQLLQTLGLQEDAQNRVQIEEEDGRIIIKPQHSVKKDA
ncbi:ATP-binding cassette domain-containing protein [Bacillus alkalicellulosilyticus]|uniref:ATP-binding cassette domain-containing protein n=1 Tax=Alkalihalobacterium alkalicellulosilyticum TaxID=1912214 RepID=UPI0009980AAE|nr:ATP-binding cassette domain-containing protein [Bacillus alkalicellulosilyticus]